MVNTNEFSKRIQNIIEYYGLTASSFAEKIGVQRSSISHILSGRNNPSLDFTLKIIDAFPEVSLNWLLLNQGDFPPIVKNVAPEEIKKVENTDLFSELEQKSPEDEIKTNTEKVKEAPPSFQSPVSTKTSIVRVIIFFKDGSFEEYHN
jgi:transcriptional regulator with XRE-family HTH domain